MCKEKISKAEWFLSDSSTDKVTYALKNQYFHLNGSGLKGVSFDAKIAAYIIESSLPDYRLTFLLNYFLDEQISKLSYPEYPYYIDKLYGCLAAKLKELNLNRLFFDIEMPFKQFPYNLYIFASFPDDGRPFRCGYGNRHLFPFYFNCFCIRYHFFYHFFSIV